MLYTYGDMQMKIIIIGGGGKYITNNYCTVSTVILYTVHVLYSFTQWYMMPCRGVTTYVYITLCTYIRTYE